MIKKVIKNNTEIAFSRLRFTCELIKIFFAPSCQFQNCSSCNNYEIQFHFSSDLEVEKQQKMLFYFQKNGDHKQFSLLKMNIDLLQITSRKFNV